MKKWINVDGVLVEAKIFKTKFSCNYEDCHGACCNAPIDEPLNGGELTKEEAHEIFSEKDSLAEYCDPEEKDLAINKPIYSSDGIYYTSLKGDKCVFCNMRCKTCALKMAQTDKKISFGIPLSCALYPLGIREVPYQRKRQKVIELWDIFERYCVSSYEKGERENIPIIQFLEEPLKRAFGEMFYQKLWNIQLQHL